MGKQSPSAGFQVTNERADAAAKSALSFPIKTMKLQTCGLIPRVSKFCFEEWQDIWQCCAGNKRHADYPVVDVVRQSKTFPLCGSDH